MNTTILGRASKFNICLRDWIAAVARQRAGAQREPARSSWPSFRFNFITVHSGWKTCSTLAQAEAGLSETKKRQPEVVASGCRKRDSTFQRETFLPNLPDCCQITAQWRRSRSAARICCQPDGVCFSVHARLLWSAVRGCEPCL